MRDWIHVEDHCSAILAVLEGGRSGEVYNIGGNAERENIQVVETILERLGKPRKLIRFVEDRPGHDRRYAICADKIRDELGWRPQRSFEEGIAETIDWYLANREWCKRVRDGEYRHYYERQYGQRGVAGP